MRNPDPDLNRFKLSLFFIYFLLGFQVFGQQTLPRFRHFSTDNGLSTSSVTSIVQDGEGKIWIGTHDGLNCFYGTFFKKYFQKDGPEAGLNQSAISSLVVAKNGLLWIGTYGGGINVMDPVSQEFLKTPVQVASLNWLQVNCLAEDRLGRIWIGCYEGLAVYDPQTRKLFKLETLPNSNKTIQVLNIAFDGDNNAFIGTPFDGLLVYSLENKFSFKSGIPFSQFKTKAKGIGFFNKIYCKNRSIIACTQSGIYNFFLNQNKIEISDYSQKIGPNLSVETETKAFLKDSEGRSWIAKGSGFVLFDRLGMEIKTDLPYKNRFQESSINELFQDKWGGIWIGSKEGLSYSHPQLGKFDSFSFSNFHQIQSFKIVWSVYTKDDVQFLLGTESGLFQFDSKNYKMAKIELPAGINDVVVYCFLETSKGSILAGTSMGLFELHKTNGKFRSKKVHTDVSGVISSIVQLRNGDFLFGTYDERGVYLVSNSGEIKNHFLHDPNSKTSLVNNSINCIVKGVDGDIWIGTDKGFSQFDQRRKSFDNTIWESSEQKRKISPLIYGIADFKDELWLGTFGSGIIVFDKGSRSFSRITTKEGLSNESIYQLQNKGDFVWASTNRGFCLIEKKRKKVKCFSESDGLQSDEYNHFASFKNPVSDKIYFGGLQGFDEVTAFKNPTNNNPPQVVLSSLFLLSDSGKTALPISSKNLILNPGEENLEIEFSALNYLMPEKNKYAYELEGTKHGRIYLGEKNKLTLIKLLPGKFILKIFASNNEGIWNTKPLEIAIEVRPHFWEKIWFKIMLGLAILIVIGLVFRLYLKARLRKQTVEFERQQAIKQERNRISADMHDDLGTGLTSIKMLSELVQIKSGQRDEPELKKIARYSEELIDNLNTIVWALNDGNDHLNHMLAYFRSYIKNQFEYKEMDLNLDISISQEMELWELSGGLRRNIFLILKESLHNVFKHSGADKVDIRFKASEGHLEFWIHDNGKGVDFEKINFGNGLRNLKNRALAIGGTLTMENKAGLTMFCRIKLYN